MTHLWTIAEIKDVLEIDSPLEGSITGISINSQEVLKGDLFIPLRGETHDAHKFVREALDKGAIASLVDHIPADLPIAAKILQVKDTFQSLIKLAHHARSRTKAQIIGVTGSFGKTTTKELLNLILSEQEVTSASVKSFNNHWGVPLSLCRLPQEAKYGVFEVGMNHIGEISPLVKILHPHIALITEVAPVHLGNFKDIEEIVRAKAEIFENMDSEGVAVLNRDSDSYSTQLKYAQAQGILHIITFGKHPEATLRLNSIIRADHSQEVSFYLDNHLYAFTLQATGDHWAMNALAALAVTKAAGGNILQACHSIKKFELLEGRGKRYRIPLPSGGEFIIIDESYNSNPEALSKALETLGEMHPTNGGRRIAILGDMYELGPNTLQIHKSIAQKIEHHQVDCVYTSGKDIYALFEAIPAPKRLMHAETVTPIAEKILQNVAAGDVILVKGSRGGGHYPRMQEVVTKLITGVL